MIKAHDEISHRIRGLEEELRAALEEKQRAFAYRMLDGRARFEQDAERAHRRLKSSLAGYLIDSRLLAVLTAPVIYAGIVPFALLDLFLFVYQGLCFPVYGVPKVRRADYIVFDRFHLKYLNWLERWNCWFCSYGNGLLAYGVEIAARTEQHWCPIKHARRLRAPHSRYPHFLDFGDAVTYRRTIESVRCDFVDLRSLASPSNPGEPPAA